MLALDKTQIERQFQRAAGSYDSAAQLQRQIFLQLCSYALSFIESPSSIADLGCGTGFGLATLRDQFADANLVGVDISQAMLEQATQCCPDSELIKADMEALPLLDAQFDMVVSSSSMQWCNPHAAISESSRILRPGGLLAVATFGPNTHREWKTAWANADASERTLGFPNFEQIEEIFEAEKIDVMTSNEQLRVLSFDSISEALQSVKNLGATNASKDRQRGLMGKNRFNRFLQAFESGSAQPQLTYQIFFLVGQKQG